MNLKKAFPLFLFFMCPLILWAQEITSFSNLKKKKIPVKSVYTLIDSSGILPSSFHVPGYDSLFYELDPSYTRLRWKQQPETDSVWVVYRTLPSSLTASIRHLNYESIRYNFIAEPIRLPANTHSVAPLLNFGSLQTGGSIGRALSFGNAQDAVVNSNMNLQLQGYIGDSIELKAAITDNNIPIQPDGSTRDFRDFDRIFIQARKNGWQASFGDIELRRQQSYFLNFYKRLQGFSFSTQNRIGNGIQNQAEIAGAIAKGKFTRNFITPLEGNQGPYKLKGANNEYYFVVLAGTERVFIDGELLQRGEDLDYVINYNTAEITFTPKRQIQKDRRIQVEFEYADRNYLNAQVFLQNIISKNDKWSLSVGAYSNADQKNSTIDQPLDNKQKQLLSQIGDSLGQAYYKNEINERYAPGKLLYKKIDTVYNGNMQDSVYILSSDTTATLYSLSFTYLGPGRGNYIPTGSNANGRVFSWVMPDANNQKKGDWEPVSLLVTPKKLQIVNASFRYKPHKGTDVSLDAALSNNDLNLYSQKDKENDLGQAWKLAVKHETNPFKLSGYRLSITAGGDFEYVAKSFRAAERIRPVEFLRDWSLPFDITPEKEKIIHGFISFKSPKGDRLGYEITKYERGASYSGIRQIIDQQFNWKSLFISGKLNRLDFTSLSQSGSFSRPTLEIKKSFPRLRQYEAAFKYFGEYNRAFVSGKDSLSQNSFAFDVLECSFKSDPGKMNRWGIQYFTRMDKLPQGSELLKANRSDNYQATAELFGNQNQQVRMVLNYRALTVSNESLSRIKPEDNFLGRVEYTTSAWQGFLNGTLLYEAGSGQELRREYSYIAVPPGQGEFTWVDYNNNGVEELNEFETAIYQDQKKYIRIFTPGNSYVKARYLQFNGNIELTPGILIRNRSGLLSKILSSSSITTALQIARKNLADGRFSFNPIDYDSHDTSIINLSSFLSNTFYFNRTNTNWGFDITHTQAKGTSLLLYGLESRNNENINLNLRVRMASSLQASLTAKLGRNNLSTDNASFQNRNYSLLTQSMQPFLTYIHQSNFRFIVSYANIKKSNSGFGDEKCRNDRFTMETRYNKANGSSINARVSFDNYTWQGAAGSENSTVGFLMLDGLRPGSNVLWNVDFIKRLGGNMEFNIQYEGRKPNAASIIHIGRAGIRALF